MLAVAAGHMARGKPRHTLPAVKYYSTALRELNLALSEPAQRSSNSTLGACLLLCVYEISHSDKSLWLQHLRGARDLILYRGGPRTSDFLCRFFSLLDISGSLSSGRGPLIQGNYWLEVDKPSADSSLNQNDLKWPYYDDESVMVNTFHELMVFMASLSKLSAQSMTKFGRQNPHLIYEKAMSIQQGLHDWWRSRPPELRDQDNDWRCLPRAQPLAEPEVLEQESFSSIRSCKDACIIYLQHIINPTGIQPPGSEVSLAAEGILDIASKTPEGYGLEMGLLWGMFMVGVAIFNDTEAEALIRRKLRSDASISIYHADRGLELLEILWERQHRLNLKLDWRELQNEMGVQVTYRLVCLILSNFFETQEHGSIHPLFKAQSDYKAEPDESVTFAGLLPLPIILETIDVYFTYCHNQPYSFFHEESFRSKLSQGKIPDHLLFAILASAVRFSKNSFFKDIFETALFYSNKSWRSIVSTCFSANKVADLATVQTVTLLSILDYTAGRSRHSGAWVKIGLAVRIAQDQKLMLESATDLPLIEQEERRRTFWSIYLLDRLASCGRARPPAILDASCQLQLPSDEESWRAGAWRQTLTLQQLSHRTLSPTNEQGPFGLVVAMAYTLSRGAQYMLQQFNMSNQDPPWDATSDFASIQSDLLYLETILDIHKPPKTIIDQYTRGGRIDQHSTGPIIFARALFHLCYGLLHHPFLLRRRLEFCPIAAPSSFLSRSFEAAWDHSKRMATLFREVRQAGALAQSSFYGYCTVVAGTIAALYLHDPSEARRTEAAAILQMHLSYLEDIGGYWKNVSSMVVALRNFSDAAANFASLSSHSHLLDPLPLEDYETLWILVDYSSMSDETRVERCQASNSNSWLDTDGNWQDIFTVFDSFEVGPQAGNNPTLEMSDYQQL
ncbi:hypothetical protein PV08_11956 [Exophiala spinifera]|uniref:Xylanolytic transcriptional activator regulatory domain-containing protein n=1 Tax=Exophiala spinifera TaxID=91928 RepID=A0A0D2ATK7_9EURO|nr:uncharacterized protein PV08_11956 [Exophiala spinifera]KIW09855.1 hypothetical protein PV08_11956 [Exophiala spinifera]